MSYQLLKHIHLTCIAVSFTLFTLECYWKLIGSPIMDQRWIKIVPHVVDTVLLASALGLAYTIGQYPFVDTWLTVKVFAVMLYIVLGSIALKRSRGKAMRIYTWLAAAAVFAYIVLVAINHNPLPFVH